MQFSSFAHPSKQIIAQQFGRAAAIYNVQAQMQKECAKQLLNGLPNSIELPTGSILEIGCGTGFVTQELLQQFPDRCLEITDLSAEMLQFCEANLQIPPHQKPLISFKQQDGEAIASIQSFALIVSGFAIQWFQNLLESLHKLFLQIKPHGFLLISFPTINSFPEWKQMCSALNLPYTANSLPDPEAILSTLQPDMRNYQRYDKTVDLSFSSSADFFRSLKSIGAGFNQSGKHLSPAEMRKLIHYWNNQTNHSVTARFHICFLAIQR